MGNPKDIFKSHSLLSEKEISDYLNGNLSEEQKKAIENIFTIRAKLSFQYILCENCKIKWSYNKHLN